MKILRLDQDKSIKISYYYKLLSFLLDYYEFSYSITIFYLKINKSNSYMTISLNFCFDLSNKNC